MVLNDLDVNHHFTVCHGPILNQKTQGDSKNYDL